MRHALAVMALTMIVGAVAPCGAVAQQFGATPTMIMPPPPSPPPPRIEIPVVPQMNAPLPTPRANLPARGSFSDRVVRCLDQGAALGLGPNDRAEYSRSCANQ